MSNPDRDNICGFDMNYDGKKDDIDDVMYFDRYSPKGHVGADEDDDDSDILDGKIYGTGKLNPNLKKKTEKNTGSTAGLSIGAIVLVVIGIYIAISGGSITAGICGAFIAWAIYAYIKNFM